MNEIQQYRQDSAKWMGLKRAGGGFKNAKDMIIEKDDGTVFLWWMPDKDHNQMAMMEDKLDEMDVILYWDTEDGHYYEIKPFIKGQRVKFSHHGRSKIEAFRLAWTEYYKTISYE